MSDKENIERLYLKCDNTTVTVNLILEDDKLKINLKESHIHLKDDLETIMPGSKYRKCEIIIGPFERRTKEYIEFNYINPCSLTETINKKIREGEIPNISTTIKIMDKYFQSNHFYPVENNTPKYQQLANKIKQYK